MSERAKTLTVAEFQALYKRKINVLATKLVVVESDTTCREARVEMLQVSACLHKLVLIAVPRDLKRFICMHSPDFVKVFSLRKAEYCVSCSSKI